LWSGWKNARGAGRTKEWTNSSKPPALDQNTISGTTSKRQSGAPSPMITIPGTSDHHHLEFVIIIVWND
jgi:hypothetical protein